MSGPGQYGRPGMPPPLPPPAWRRRSWPIVVAVLAPLVAVLLLVTAVLAFFVARSHETLDTKGAPVKKLTWTERVDSSKSKRAFTTDVWFGRDVLVRGTRDGLRAYDLGSGDLRWRLKSPVPNPHDCGMSATAKDGVGYALGSKNGRCDELFAIQLKTGKVLSRTHLGFDVGFYVRLDFAGGGLVSSWKNSITAIDPAHPKKPWWRVQVAPFPCTVDWVRAEGMRVLALSQCGGNSSKVTAYDAATGEREWRTKVSAGDAILEPLSVTPPVLSYDAPFGSGEPATLLGFDPGDGHIRMRVDAALDGGDPLDPGPDNVAVFGRRMVVGGDGVAAFDVATGDRLWSKRVGRTRFTVPHQPSGKRVYARGSSVDAEADALVAFDVKSGAIDVTARLKPAREDLAFSAGLTWVRGCLVAVHYKASGGSGYRTLEVYA